MKPLVVIEPELCDLGDWDGMVRQSIINHYPLIDTPDLFKRVFSKACALYPLMGIDKISPDKSELVVECAVIAVCPEKRGLNFGKVVISPTALIAGIIAERWPLNSLDVEAELKIATLALGFYNAYGSYPVERAVKAVTHAHQQWLEQHLSEHE
jgi:hypothetical protein